MVTENEWKILNYDDIRTNHYEINNQGHIRLYKSKKEIKPFIDKWGYVEYILSHNEFYKKKQRVRKHYKAHALVMITFGNPDDIELYLRYKITRKIVINHKDGNKQNNDITNLEVISTRENVLHALQMNLKKSGLEATSFKWLNQDTLNKIYLLLEVRTPSNIIIDKLNLTEFEPSRKRLRVLINNIYAGMIMNYKTQNEKFRKTKINISRPCVYEDKTIELICQMLDDGYKNYQIVEKLFDVLGWDGSLKMKRRYKALVSNIKNRVHRTDISNNYSFWK